VTRPLPEQLALDRSVGGRDAEEEVPHAITSRVAARPWHRYTLTTETMARHCRVSEELSLTQAALRFVWGYLGPAQGRESGVEEQWNENAP